uniref:Uncharacterized protein n=1 Tax=Leersia perrieri TaxID=77586 RepID=A0A0D9WN03_9ORYZ
MPPSYRPSPPISALSPSGGGAARARASAAAASSGGGVDRAPSSSGGLPRGRGSDVDRRRQQQQRRSLLSTEQQRRRRDGLEVRSGTSTTTSPPSPPARRPSPTLPSPSRSLSVSPCRGNLGRSPRRRIDGEQLDAEEELAVAVFRDRLVGDGWWRSEIDDEAGWSSPRNFAASFSARGEALFRLLLLPLTRPLASNVGPVWWSFCHLLKADP